jgi:uncharacterized membrane protein (DUF485 family)
MPEHETRLTALGVARWRIAGALTAVMMLIYFGFIWLIAYHKDLLARVVTRGLTLGILLGALVIVASWILTWVYVRWANGHYDSEVGAMRK